MAHLKKRGNTYHMRYRDPITGQEHTKALNTDSLQIALHKLAAFNYQTISSNTPTSPTATRTPLFQVVQEFTGYINLHKDPINACKYRSVLRSIFGRICDGLKYEFDGNERYHDPFRPVLKAEYLEDLTTTSISDYLDTVLKRTDKKGIERGYVGKKTRNRYRETLHFLFEWALMKGRYHMLDGNPVTDIPYLDADKLDIRYLSSSAIDRQLSCLTDHQMLQAMVATYIFAGLRREEALWLTADDIDLKRGVIKVHEKTDNGEHWKPKNGDDRIVPLNNRLRTYLECYQPAQSDSGWFFPNPAGKRWHPDVFAEHLRKVNMEKLHCPALRDNPLFEMAVALYLNTSLDLQHILQLTNKDIDLESGIILSRRKKVWRLLINGNLKPIISAYTTIGSKDAPFIPAAKGGAWDVAGFRRALQDTLRDKDIDWSCDEYRHTYGSHLAQNGVSTFKIAKFMGNSEAIVIKHYAMLLAVDSRDNLEF